MSRQSDRTASTESAARAGMSFSRRFFRLTIPNILSNVTVPLVGLADTIMLGHLPEVRFLAGVALASVIFDYVYWSFGFLRMSTTGLTAQAMGRGDREEVFLLLYRGLFLAAVIGTSILVIQQPLMRLSFALLSGSPEVETAGMDYFRARIWGAPAALANFTFLGWYLGREESHRALLMTAIGNVANVLLNYVFLYVLHLAAFGAGLGSMLSQYLMLATALWLFRRTGSAVPWRWSRVLQPNSLSAILRLNLDILIRTVSLISAFALFTNFGARLGTLVLAANSILLRFLDVAAYFIDGAAFATESLAGVFWGARNRAALRRLLRYAFVTGEAFAIAFIMGLLLFPEPIFRAMTSHQQVIELLKQYDHWFGMALLFGAVAYMLDGFFLGLTQGRTLRNAMIVSFGVGFLPLAMLAVHLQKNHWLWASLVVFMIFRCLTLGLPLRRLLREPAQTPVARPGS